MKRFLDRFFKTRNLFFKMFYMLLVLVLVMSSVMLTDHTHIMNWPTSQSLSIGWVVAWQKREILDSCSCLVCSIS